METRDLVERHRRIGLGTAALGRPAYMVLGHDRDFPEGRSPEAMERHAHRVFDAAWASGIRWIDTARSYGNGEAFVRSWLDARKISPGSIGIGSKWGYRYVGGWRLDAATHEVKDHSLGALQEQLAESRRTLGPWLSLYQIHSATQESGVLENDAVLDELALARDAGLRIGLTTSGPAQASTVRRAISIRRGGSPLFSSVQSTWNLLERSCEEALREAHEAGCTVLIKEVFANGRLSPRGDAAGGDAAGGALGELALQLGVTVDAIAVAAALAQDFADRLILGAATEAQLASQLRGASIELQSGALESLAALREEAASYWRRRSQIPWT